MFESGLMDGHIGVVYFHNLGVWCVWGGDKPPDYSARWSKT